MSTAAADPSGADESAIRAHAGDLTELARSLGITNLRLASRGRLVGYVGETLDELDLAGFDAAASQIVGAPVQLFSDRVLGKENVSPDLVAAQPL